MIQRLAYIIAIFYCVNLFALGQTAHRATGAIAENYLTKETKVAIKELIGIYSLAEISTYVDEMRALKENEFWSKTSQPYHYVTVPTGKTYAEVGAPEQGDGVFALNKYSEVIGNPSSSKEEKILALKFIVHIIGDLHQPLHVGTGLDRGGNDVKVNFFNQSYNLHSVWDTVMIKQTNLSYTELTEWLNKHITEDDITSWSSTDPLVWVKESYDIRETIYPKNTNLSYEYLHHNLPTIKVRIQQAGVRIAVYLNALFGSKK
ncbi:MAG: S1/P1 nuclease [Gammaproteobacteria bacterium]|nr:S1/P1 nuclease [Gammaproteobacteria bacterium]